MQPGGVPAAQCLLMPFAATDGSLSRVALNAGVDRLFVAADANADGALDVREVRSLNEARKSTCDRSPIIDYGGTGIVDRRAFGSRYVTAFTQADTDSDGAVSAIEMEVARRPPRMPPERDRGDPGERRPGDQR